MDRNYSPGVRFNNQMGTLESLSFVGEGVGASLFFGGAWLGRSQLMALGVVFVIGAVAALLLHLGNPQRSWRALARIATSGVSRGTAMIGAFLGCAILAFGARTFDLPPPVASAFTLGACLFALPLTIYGGMLLGTMKAVRLWRGFFVPASFGAQSLATASVLGAWLLSDTLHEGALQVLAIVLLPLGAALAAAHLLLAERSAGVRASLQRLLEGDLRLRLLFGAAGLGFLFPLVAVGASHFAGLSADVAAILLALAAASRLAGDFAYRNCVVVAGAYEPYMPVMPFRSLGKPV